MHLRGSKYLNEVPWITRKLPIKLLLPSLNVFFFLKATKAGSGAEGEVGTDGEVTDPPPRPCGWPGGGLAACIRRVEASSYYDNDGTLPSMCAAH